MADHDSGAFVDLRQAIQDYSDTDLLAFWAATEAATDTVQDEPAISPREAAVIAFAAQELAKRGLLPG